MLSRASGCDNVPAVGSKKLGRLAASLMVVCACAPAALASGGFRPRIGGAMGIVPLRGHQEIALGTAVPVVYHGGSVMRGVTIHTIFWAPSGFKFDGPPSGGGLSYEQLIQQFLTNVANASGTGANVFSVLPEYPDRSGPGTYQISYNASVDSIDDTAPYPRPGNQCASPAGIATCITDLQLQREIDRVVQSHDPSGRGLHDIWFVFLPPDVDTCAAVGQCGTTAFAGYHSLLNLGHGSTIYVTVPDPLIEGTPGPGSAPEGNPEAESAIDTAAHETVEAITDPQGAGWMDSNGFEVGDKCETPQIGIPLGFAPNGAPYDQLIGGNPYLIQTMWSNAASGCKQSSASTSSALPLATVSFRQFSPFVGGNIGTPRKGVAVIVALARAGTIVAIGGGSTGPRGGWGPVALQSISGSLQGVGDDRDTIVVRYGAHGPKPDLIQTGDGGNPFTQSGWTGWFALDNGYAVRSSSVLLGPCSQTGVLDLTVDGSLTAPPIEQCETESDVAVIRTKSLRPATALSFSSTDNRAVTFANTAGALVKLTVPVGEPGGISALGNALVPFNPSGFPLCDADLRSQGVSCTGLVPGTQYSLTRLRRHAVKRARATAGGTAIFRGFASSGEIAGGDLLALRNRAGRTLTALHVAHLRVDITGQQTAIASGSCEPGDYYGPPLSTPPTGVGIGNPGVADSGTICPVSGDAAKLPAARITQVDDRSGGQTHTEVPLIASTAPAQDAILYGPFVALAQTALPGAFGSTFTTGARVALTITPAGSRRAVFRAANVNTARGMPVRALPRGTYVAKWVLRDANGDTRTIRTTFVEAR